MTAFPKHSYVRSKKLLEACRQIPCQHCGIDDGTVCAAHANWGFGKGRSIKADDNRVSSLCTACHQALDQGRLTSKEQRQQAWWSAHSRTVRELSERGLWPAGVPKPDISASPFMEFFSSLGQQNS